MSHPETLTVVKGEAKAGAAPATGSDFGNGGLSAGPGVSPGALAFLKLCSVMDTYNEIVEMKTELSTASGKAALQQVDIQNLNYGQEVTDQASQQLFSAFSSLATAVGSGVMLGMGLTKAFKQGEVGSKMRATEVEQGQLSTLRDQLLEKDPPSVAVAGRGPGPASLLGDAREVERALTQEGDPSFNEDVLRTSAEHPEEVKLVGAKMRGELQQARTDIKAIDDAISAIRERAGDRELNAGEEREMDDLKAQRAIKVAERERVERIFDRLDSRISSAGQRMVSYATQLQTIMMSLQLSSQMWSSACQAVSQFYTYMNKTTDGWQIGPAYSQTSVVTGKKDDSVARKGEIASHNQAQLQQLYGQLAQSVMSNVTQQIFKAWDQALAVMSQVMKGIWDSGRPV